MDGATIFGILLIFLLVIPAFAAACDWSDDLNNKE